MFIISVFKYCVRKSFTFVLLHMYNPWLTPVNSQVVVAAVSVNGHGISVEEVDAAHHVAAQRYTLTVAGYYTENYHKVKANLAIRLNARRLGSIHCGNCAPG